MADAGRVRRDELAFALLGLTGAVAALIVALDAVRFHGAAPPAALTGRLSGELHAEAVAVLALAFAAVAVAMLALRAAARELLAQRSLVRRLEPLGTARVDGRTIVVVAGRGSVAFCAGLLRPRIFVSQGALRRLSAAELRAVIAHEGHHADRRDPLRLLVARSLTAGLRRCPAVDALGRRQAVLSELAADAAAVRSLGSTAPLAGALLPFDEDHSGVTPERVDQLLGELAPARIPRTVLALGAVGLVALLADAWLVLTLPRHSELAAIGAAPLAAAAVYAVIARRRGTVDE